MCFGNEVTANKTTTTPPSWLTSAAQSNLTAATNLQNNGFTPYTGQQVASFSPQQQASFGMGTDVANATGGNVMPGADALSYALSSATSGAPYSPISANMSPYMNQYVSLALQPQLQQAANTYMLQSQAQQGGATSAGAFGDPRAALLQSNLGLNYALENQGLVGNAYNAAFNTAIGAGAQDVSNKLNAWGVGQNAAVNASNAAFTQATGGANLENTFGSQQTAQSQAQLNAMYNQWLMAQQYPFQTSANVNSALQAGQAGAPQTSTTMAPDNTGYALLGSLIGAAGSAAGGYLKSDVRTKTDIAEVGKMSDGLPVYRYRYKDDPTNVVRLGLMAQDVEQVYPAAVKEFGGVKAVNYAKATEKARSLSFGLAA